MNLAAPLKKIRLEKCLMNLVKVWGANTPGLLTEKISDLAGLSKPEKNEEFDRFYDIFAPGGGDYVDAEFVLGGVKAPGSQHQLQTMFPHLSMSEIEAVIEQKISERPPGQEDPHGNALLSKQDMLEIFRELKSTNLDRAVDNTDASQGLNDLNQILNRTA